MPSHALLSGRLSANQKSPSQPPPHVAFSAEIGQGFYGWDVRVAPRHLDHVIALTSSRLITLTRVVWWLRSQEEGRDVAGLRSALVVRSEVMTNRATLNNRLFLTLKDRDSRSHL